MYQERESIELTPVRQLLNAPPHLLPKGRVVSLLDLMQQLRITESKILTADATQVCSSNPFFFCSMPRFSFVVYLESFRSILDS